MPEKTKYKIKVGSHASGGRVYTAGEIIESDKDLLALFPEKFERVTERIVYVEVPARKSAPLTNPPVVDPLNVGSTEPETKTEAPAVEPTAPVVPPAKVGRPKRSR
jgi:hypothetical protein